VPADSPELLCRAYDALDVDLIWFTHWGLINWAEAGRTTDMGHATYAPDGSDRRERGESPFRSVEEVWAFDAVEEYGLPDFDAQVAAYEQIVQEGRRAFPGQLRTGGYYQTIVSGAIEAFGWEMLLLAAADREKMARVLDTFLRRTMFFMRAWAQTSAEVLIQHDDFVWTGGAFLHPEFYRRAIIPRYADLWNIVHEAGKKVLFCSDGNFTEFAGEIVEAGADGLIFEPCMDFGEMADRFGDTTCLVGSYVDCRDLARGRWEKVRADIDRTLEALARCRGALFAVGNHLAPDIAPAMLDRYFDHLLPRLGR
jgi:hypothetical protein